MFLAIIILVLIFIDRYRGLTETIVLVLAITIYLFFVPKYKTPPFCTTFISSPVVANLIKSGLADKAALEFLDAAALPIILVISNALSGLLATFFPKLTVALPKFLKKSFNPSASIVHFLTLPTYFSYT